MPCSRATFARYAAKITDGSIALSTARAASNPAVQPLHHKTIQRPTGAFAGDMRSTARELWARPNFGKPDSSDALQVADRSLAPARIAYLWDFDLSCPPTPSCEPRPARAGPFICECWVLSHTCPLSTQDSTLRTPFDTHRYVSLDDLRRICESLARIFVVNLVEILDYKATSKCGTWTLSDPRPRRSSERAKA